MKIQPWIDRKWQLGVAQWKVPYLMERLEGTPIRLAHKLNEAVNIYTKRIADNQWTILEHAGHIWDTETLFFSRFKEFEQGKKDLMPADMSNKKTWAADYNSKSSEYIIDGLSKARGEIITLLKKQDDSFFASIANHPRLKQPMTPADLMYFSAEHDDYHLARITELIKLLS